MMRAVIPATLVALATAVSGPGPVDIALEAASWVDVTEGRLRGPSVFLISGNRIARIVEPKDFAPGDAVETINLGQSVLMPGLIDGHVHLQLGGSAEANAGA